LCLPEGCLPSPEGEREKPKESQTPPVTYTVRIALASDRVGRGEFQGRVKLGLAGRAELLCGRETVLSLLVKRIRRVISLG
jgi:hypothetical protein